MLYTWIEALAFEIEAAGRSVGGRTSKLGDLYERGFGKISDTEAGARLGGWVRQAGGALADIPVISWQGDLIAGRHGIDTLAGNVAALPIDDGRAGLAALQLAEAVRNMRRERLALRAAFVLVNPLSTAASTSLRAAGQLGATVSSHDRLVRRGHRIAAHRVTGGVEEYVDQLTLARAYLAGEQPRRAITFARRALVTAMANAETASDSVPSAGSAMLAALRARDVGLAARHGRAGAREMVAGTYASLSSRERWRRLAGTALVVAAWGHLELGEYARVDDAAAAAVTLGNTCGYLPQAAAVRPTAISVRERLRLLGMVEPRDRREYAGVARGDVATGYQLTRLQAGKTAQLMRRTFRAMTSEP